MGNLSEHFDKSISIHAPNEGSDFIGQPTFAYVTDISIHAPNEGSDKDFP